MTEIGFVGDGRDTYQLWVGGSPTLDGRTGFALLDRMKDKNMEETLAKLFAYWRDDRSPAESFGEFTHRKGKEDLLAFMDGYTVTEEDLKDEAMYDEDAASDSDASLAEITPVLTQDELNAEMAAAARPKTPAATKEAMEKRIEEDKEVAKETTLGMVTRIGTREEAPAAKHAAEQKAPEKPAEHVDEAAVTAEKKAMSAEEVAAVKAAAQAASQVSEADMAAELKAKAEDEQAAAGLTRAHEAAAQERERIQEEKAAAVPEPKPSVAESKPPEILVTAKQVHIRDVFAYRVFKRNPQWCVEWTVDNSVSWESLDKIDSDDLREKALVLQKAEAN
jgi:hypothetical protein